MLHVPAVAAIVTNYRDITDAMTLQEQQAFDRSNLSALINSTQDMMWSVDRDYRIITVTRRRADTFEPAIGFRIKPGGVACGYLMWRVVGHGCLVRPASCALAGVLHRRGVFSSSPYDIYTENRLRADS